MRLVYFLFLCGLSLSAGAYPEMTSWKGKPSILFENKKTAPLQKNYVIKSNFFVVTANDDEVSLQMTTQSTLTVFEKSKVQVPEVFAPAIATYEIFLLAGEIRIQQKGESADQKLNQIRNVFFDLTQSKNADAIIILDMKEPSVEVQMVSGEWNLEFFAYEKKLTLKAGEKVKFSGLLAADGEGIKYDYLLGGRKVPQGQLGPVEKFEISQFYAKEKANEKRIQDQKNALKKIAEEKMRKRKAYEDSFLCKNPFGQENQCAWWVESDKCYRKRCNVSGQWGDVTERPLLLETKCTPDFSVAECDY